MKRLALLAALGLLALPASAQDTAYVTPAGIVASAPKEEWAAIAPEDLLGDGPPPPTVTALRAGW